MKKVIFATGNEGKMKEIREILGDLDIELLSLKDAGIHADIVEDGKTFEENAQIKAKAICDLTGENSKICLCHCSCLSGWKHQNCERSDGRKNRIRRKRREWFWL